MGAENEAGWITCPYFGFWDVPRNLLLPYEGRLFLLDCPFEEEQDDYRPDYSIWELTQMPLAEAEALSPAEREARKSKQWADLSVKALRFDPKRDRQDGRFYARVQFAEPGKPFPEAFPSPA